MPARGWHGEAYRGHIFWDELFVLPFFNLRLPHLTRSFLMYRYRRLDKARQLAAEAGFKGAMFPWESASNGDEQTPPMYIDAEGKNWIPAVTSLERHGNSAIVYNIWRYYQSTEDLEFLSFYGAEMILEIARFWASLCRYDAEHDDYEIWNVIGPDEYHTAYDSSPEPGLKNNSYTNYMAAWVMTVALSVLKLLPEDRCHHLKQILAITENEVETWGPDQPHNENYFLGGR